MMFASRDFWRRRGASDEHTRPLSRLLRTDRVLRSRRRRCPPDFLPDSALSIPGAAVYTFWDMIGHFRHIASLALCSPLAASPGGLDLIQRYCYDCHGEGMKKGGISLEDLIQAGPAGHGHDWQKVWKMNRNELMPPAGKDGPTAQERRLISEWISAQMLGVDLENPDPGRVTIRRLNRMEYEYTVTDLFGTDLQAEGMYSVDDAVTSRRLRDMLPPDDKAFGFDNIGDFQSLSPALLETYFEIAEFVVANVIALDGPLYPETNLGDPLEVTRSEEEEKTDHRVTFRVEKSGDYRVGLRFSLGGWAEYGGGYDFTVEMDGNVLLRERIDVGGHATHVYNPQVRLKSGEHELVLSTVARDPDFKGMLRHLELRPRVWLNGPMDPAAANFPDSHKRIFFRGPAPEEPEAKRNYASEILRRMTGRAFRRPVDEETLERLGAIAMLHENFERGIADALTAVLTSPRFLFRSEAQPQPNETRAVHPIDEFALASRLSYLLWLSLPDEELRSLAAEGKLREQLESQLARMLADPKAARFFEDFPGQWLRTRNVLMTPVSRRDEELNPVRESMKRETEMLFEHIAREDRDLIELVTANYTFVDGRLADFYGMADLAEPGFHKVNLAPESRRGGILTQGSFLVATSNPNRTSPVKRGLFVLENLMAIEPPPPPPDIPSLDEARANGERPRTVREQLELHRNDQSCASCHAHFDPIGLVLENYDVIGKWRDDEGGEPIQPSETTVTGHALDGVEDLRAYILERRDNFYRCVTEKLMTYALGRGLGPADAVTVDEISLKLRDSGGKFSVLLGELVRSRPFQMRRGDDGKVIDPPRADIPEAPPPEKRKGRRFSAEEFRRAQQNGRQPSTPGEAD